MSALPNAKGTRGTGRARGLESGCAQYVRQRMLLDANLAALYGVPTGALVQAVKRNLERFPEDFIFQLTADEW